MAVRSQYNNRLAPLAAFGTDNDTFTGLTEETILGNSISVNYKSDQDTLMKLQQSPDGENWYIEDQKLFLANVEYIYQHPSVLQFFRVIIQNQSLVDQEYGNLITSLVQIQTDNISVNALIGDITPAKDGILTYGLNGSSPLATRVNTEGSLITTFSAVGASAASATVCGTDNLGATYPLPLTTGGAEIKIALTESLPTGSNLIGGVAALALAPSGGDNYVPINADATGSLITTFSAVGASAASATVCGTDNLGVTYPLPLTSGGAEVKIALTESLPAGTAHIGEVSISNLPEIQPVSGTVTVASITDPLPAGTNALGQIQIQASELFDGLQPLSSIKTLQENSETQLLRYNLCVNSKAIQRKDYYITNLEVVDSSITTYGVLQSAYNPEGVGGQAALPLPLNNDNSTLTLATSTKATVGGDTTLAASSAVAYGFDGTNYYATPLTAGGSQVSVAVSNYPVVQDISGTVTVASITDPLPAGTNSLGQIQLQAYNMYQAEIQSISCFKSKITEFIDNTSLCVASQATPLRDVYIATESVASSIAAYGVLQQAYDELSSVGQAALPLPLNNENKTLTLATSTKATTTIGEITTVASSAVAYGFDGTNYYATPLTAGGSQVSVAVSNYPVVQDISGTVTVASITASLPAGTAHLGEVSIANYPVVQDISGTVTVAGITTSLPAGTAHLGEVSIANYPVVQDISGTVTVASITASLPAGTAHLGEVSIANYPAVQVVAGEEVDYMFFPTPATNVAQVYADGIPGVNVTGGWSYTSTQTGTPPFTGSSNKINWYLYGSAGASTDYKVSQLTNVYAVINQKSILGMASELPFITIYTRPDSGTNAASWYKNKLTYDTLHNSLYDGTTGMKLLYTGDDPVAIHPEITGLNRVKLNFDPDFSSVASESLAQGNGVMLGSLQTNSLAAPNGTRNFVFQEYSMLWAKTPEVIPIKQNQVQVFDTALNASVAALVTDLSGVTITAGKLQVGGAVSVSNFPTTQPVSGSISISNLPTTQPISGTVAISNFPEGGSNVTIVSALPAGTNNIGQVLCLANNIYGQPIPITYGADYGGSPAGILTSPLNLTQATGTSEQSNINQGYFSASFNPPRNSSVLNFILVTGAFNGANPVKVRIQISQDNSNFADTPYFLEISESYKAYMVLCKDINVPWIRFAGSCIDSSYSQGGQLQFCWSQY